MKRPLPKTFSSGQEFVDYVYRTYHHQLLLHAKRLCSRYRFDSSFADDFLQETFIRLQLKWERRADRYSLHGVRSFFPIIRSRIIDAVRKRESMKRLNRIFTLGYKENADIVYLCLDQYMERLKAILNERLSPENARIMILYYEGYKYREIADIIGMKTDTVSSRIHRIRKKLKDLL
jgi:RNA polymerase sigma factor (sigma-70 family)